jgi:hypothetical protein
MNGRWKCSLGLWLGLLAASASADEFQWRPAARPSGSGPAAPAVSLGAPVTAAQPVGEAPRPSAPSLTSPVLLGTPVVSQPLLDRGVQPVSFSQGPDPQSFVFRGQSPDTPKPMPAGPATGDEANVLKMPTPVSPPAGGKPFPPGTVIFGEYPPPSVPALGGKPLPPGTVVIGEYPPSPVPVPAGSPLADCPCQPDCCPNCCVEAEATCPCDSCLGSNRRFWVNGEYLMWWRKGSPQPPLVTSSLSTAANAGALGAPGTVLLYGNRNLDSPLHSGLRFGAGYWFDNDQTIGVDGSFFFLFSRSQHFTVGSAGTPGIFRPFFRVNSLTNPDTGEVLPPGPDAQIVAFPGRLAGRVVVDSSSKMFGADANVRTRLCCDSWYRVDLLGGFRYVGLDESLRISEDLQVLESPGGRILLADQFKTENRFYGGQIGVDSQFRYGRWVFDARTKLALGATHEVVDISGATLNINPTFGTSLQPGGLLAAPSNIGRFSQNRLAFMPEVGLNVGYQVTDSLKVYMGYDFLYLSSVVRPGNQIDQAVNTTQLPRADRSQRLVGEARPLFAFHGSDFWAQGLHFGLEFTY